MSSTDTTTLELALRYCQDAPLRERGTASYNPEDLLGQLRELKSAVERVCSAGSEILEGIETSGRVITLREEILLAVLHAAAVRLGNQALILDDIEVAFSQYPPLDPCGLPPPFAATLFRMPEGVSAVDLAVNVLSESIAQIHRNELPKNDDPDPRNIEEMKTFAKNMLEPHFWPVRPTRSSTINVSTKANQHEFLRRFRLPTLNEARHFAVATFGVALILFLFTESLASIWIASISISVGLIWFFMIIRAGQEIRKDRRKEIDRKREDLFIPQSVTEEIYKFDDRFQSVARAGPRGIFARRGIDELPLWAQQNIKYVEQWISVERQVGEYRHKNPPPRE